MKDANCLYQSTNLYGDWPLSGENRDWPLSDKNKVNGKKTNEKCITADSLFWVKHDIRIRNR